MDKTTPRSMTVPCIEELDTMSPDEIVSTLDNSGRRETIDTLNWPGQYDYRPLTTFSIAHSKTAIYIDFFVRCNYLRAVHTANNSDVYQDSCVEFFVQPDPSDRHYYNFEFNCIGAPYASRRTDRNNFELFTDEQLDRIRRIPSCGSRPFQEVEGLFNWNLLVVIPLDLIGIHYENHPVTMRGNFYKCADMTTVPHFLTWSPIESPTPDFHRPEYFGEITLE
ncbi:MAG: carbohydrate-binding family 9-like protein [Clostridium sp.]|nr:carbohydrate-binding family 9-like protein [Clostridium sp.]